jgi:TonB family protein
MRCQLMVALTLTTACAHTSPQQRNPSGQVDANQVVFTVGVVDSPPTVSQCPPARYPETLRQARVHGAVVVELIVDTLGHPEPASLRIVQSPDDSLSAAAHAAVLGCEFAPGRIGRRPVRVLIDLPITFDSGQ